MEARFEHAAQPLAGPRVLLVEDNGGDALLVRLMLEEAWPDGVTLEHVQTLAAGVASLGARPPDCVILDMSLPDADGLHGLQQMLTGGGGGVPIVVLTGRDDEQLAVRAVAEGAQDYLVKGAVDAQRLRRALRYAIERARTPPRAETAEPSTPQMSARQLLERLRTERASRNGDRFG